MCRIAAYLGPSITLDRLLTDPPHSLLVQSWAPRELRYAKLNADGYGFGWYPNAGQPAVYVNPDPIWTDPNLPHLGRALASGLWLASIRSATIGNPVNHANTQPFADNEFLFDHNGLIDNFHDQVRPRISIGSINPIFTEKPPPPTPNQPGQFAARRSQSHLMQWLSWLNR
ncbi:MAG: class II glutamine amidotransferase, partial [Pseudomonadota bacterium]|nr:class II glutamine amidotransferase [Pseudomonadota bacterium]